MDQETLMRNKAKILELLETCFKLYRMQDVEVQAPDEDTTIWLNGFVSISPEGRKWKVRLGEFNGRVIYDVSKDLHQVVSTAVGALVFDRVKKDLLANLGDYDEQI